MTQITKRCLDTVARSAWALGCDQTASREPLIEESVTCVARALLPSESFESIFWGADNVAEAVKQEETQNNLDKREAEGQKTGIQELSSSLCATSNRHTAVNTCRDRCSYILQG